jgi:protein TonB
MPVRQTPGRGWLVAGATASVVLHGAVLAALVLWPAAEPEPERGEEGAVAMVFADIVDAGGAGAAEDPAPPEPPSMPAPPPVPVAAAPPAAPPAPPAPDAGPPAEAGILPPPAPPPPEPAAAPPAEAQPGPASEPPPAPPRPLAEAPPPAQPVPPAQPAPMAEATPDDPPPAPVQVAAPRPQHPARPPSTQGQLRLDAGIGALPDPSFGAQAMGAVVPPGTEAGQRNAPPDYPSESRRRGEEGVVRLALRVGTDGSVLTAEVAVSSGHPRLDAAALEAARRWRFRPATQAGLPVAATLPTAVHFRLTDARGR